MSITNYNMPDLFADPLASFEVIRKQAKASQKFWIHVKLLFFVSFITNWRLAEVKNYLIIAGVAYLVIISTAAYFAREVIAFMTIPVDASKIDELIGRVTFWYRSPMVWNVLQFLALILNIIATYKKLKS